MEIKLYTENTPELRERFEKAGIKFGRNRDIEWGFATLECLYADSSEAGIVQSTWPINADCTHATADEFFAAVCQWFGVEVKDESEWKSWVPGRTAVLVSDLGNALDGGYRRIWLGYFNGLHLTVHHDYEKDFLAGQHFETITWRYAKLPEPVRLTRKQIAEKFGVAEFEIVEE